MITLKAHAKINLGLRITGKLPNGYHQIHSLFLPIPDVYDSLTFETNEHELKFLSDDSLGIAHEHNLVMKAANALRTFLDIQKGAKITLSKNIPSGAGLGGGSSDAACTLRGLATLWGIEVESNDLRALGLSLGSDVPFFLQDNPAIIEGQGEIIHPLDLLVNGWLILVMPNIHVSTPWAYGQITSFAPENFSRFDTAIKNGVLDLHSRIFVNDFEQPVFDTYPQLLKIKQQLLMHGPDIALMSGSGSTMYGIFSDRGQALEAMSTLKEHRCIMTSLNSLKSPKFTDKQ